MRKKVFWIGVVFALLCAAGWFVYRSLHIPCIGNICPIRHVGPANLYPDSRLTPGDVFSSATVEEVCERGYTKRVRHVPRSKKEHVFANYGIPYPQPEGAYEVDHFIPLELGGSNDVKNLWLEPANPHPGFHEKDIVENYLHHEVCTGHKTLHDAQEEIRTDWYRVYLQIKNKS